MPPDRPTTPELTAIVRAGRPDAVAYTRFAWGVFDVTVRLPVGPGPARETGGNPGPLLVAADRRARGLGPAVGKSAEAGLGGPPVRPRRAVWDLPGYHWAVSHGRRVVIVDPDGGFHLNHRQEFLPPAGPLRDAYRYMSLPARSWPALSGRWLRLVSDGEQAIALLADSTRRGAGPEVRS